MCACVCLCARAPKENGLNYRYRSWLVQMQYTAATSGAKNEVKKSKGHAVIRIVMITLLVKCAAAVGIARR